MNTANTLSQMRKGLLELCILSLLREGASYPTEILNKLKAQNMIVVEGTLYPLLNRMMREGMLTYEWRESDAGPPRKYYRLTDAGTACREELTVHWKKISTAVESIIQL